MKNRSVLILGGSSDIGINLINLFLLNKWKVTAHYNENKISSKLKIKKNIFFSEFKFDLRKIDNFETYIDNNDFNSFDAFVNLAGYFKPKSFKNFTIKNYYDHINVNTLSSLLVIKKIIPNMKKNKWGRIVNTSSIGTKFGGGMNSFAYSLSKFNNEFFPQYYKTLYSKNIIINTLQIGLTDTKLLKKLPSKNYNNRLKKIPIRRMAKPAEVANYILYLCGNNNKLLTNSVINISGGE